MYKYARILGIYVNMYKKILLKCSLQVIILYFTLSAKVIAPLVYFVLWKPLNAI